MSPNKTTDCEDDLEDDSDDKYLTWTNTIKTDRNVRRTRTIFNLLSTKPNPPPHNLRTDENGNLLKSADEVATIWNRLLKKKYQDRRGTDETTNESRSRRTIARPRIDSPTQNLTRPFSNSQTARPQLPLISLYKSNGANSRYNIHTNQLHLVAVPVPIVLIPFFVRLGSLQRVVFL